MRFSKSQIHNILLVSLTNIGDVILTLPVLDILKEEFPNAKVSLVIGPKAESLFEANPHLKRVYVYNKRQKSIDAFRWICKLRREKFDLAIDLRNSAIPFLLRCRYKTSFVDRKDNSLHMMQKHLARLKTIVDFNALEHKRFGVHVTENVRQRVKRMLVGVDLGQYFVIAPGSAAHEKRWLPERFAQVADQIYEQHALCAVIVGDKADENAAMQVSQFMKSPVYNLAAKTTLLDLAEILMHSVFALLNDSAPMHLASYLNIPTFALFGPSNPKKYAPWSTASFFYENMNSIHPEKVINDIGLFLKQEKVL